MMIEILITICFFMLFVLEFYKDLIYYQQNQYILKRYTSTLFRKQRFIALSGILATILVLLIDNRVSLFVFIMIVTFISYVVEYNKNYKVKFKFTARMIRMLVLIMLCSLLFVLFIPLEFLAILLCINMYVFILFHFIMMPVETTIRNSFMNKAKNKLETSHTTVVGITGSYGKTTSKNILFDILKHDFHTLPTPKSFNTPMGLSITINNELTALHEVFIAEMGAYKIGEIQENCDVARPDIAIITSIGKAHLESFGSQENILQGKFEIVESLSTNGLAILNADDALMMSYKIKNDCNVKTYSIDKASDLQAYNIVTTINGVSFNIKVDNKEYLVKTKLLGKHNVYNILSCILVGLHLGMSMETIVKNISNVNVITHRLELRKVNGATIIDDAFNSNPVGAKEAALTLGMMEGYRVALTPGMIELGDDEYELNKAFAIQLSENADFVYIVSSERSKPFIDGFREVGYDNYSVVKTVDEGFNKFFSLQKSDKVLLIENDLSDIY